MRAEAIEEFSGYGYGPDQMQWETWAEMRYRGQGFELPVEIDLDRLASEGQAYLNQIFHHAHRLRYGTAAPNDNIELVSYRLVAQVPSDWKRFDHHNGAGEAFAQPSLENATVVFGGARENCRFVRREKLPGGYSLAGLAIVEEETATTLIPPGWRMTVGPERGLLLEQERPA
jgi:N-methylhydantoinase A